MTIDDLIQASARHSMWVLLYFVLPPAVTWGIGKLHKTSRLGIRRPYNLVYSCTLYLVTFPGIMAAVLTGYGLFFLRADLRHVPILLYFVPIVSMMATWFLSSRQVDLDRIPGFERLTGFMLAIAICFVVAFAINRLFFGILFFGSLSGLLLVAIGTFVVFRMAVRRIVR